MLHTLASTFTTCACGAKARDCVLARIAEFVENQTPLTPSPSPPSQFTKEKQEFADKVFADFKPGWSRPYFPGATHGFAVRGDLSDPRVKAAKEGAFKNTVEWFIKYL